jgi:hypothetical protein
VRKSTQQELGVQVGSSISAYEAGMILTSRRRIVSGGHPVGGRRGAITGFSRASARRLRERMVVARPAEAGDFIRVGLTLTIPGDVAFEGDYLAPDYLKETQRTWDAFRISLARAFPSVGWFWRVEMQQRRAPHWHLVGLVPLSLFGLSRGDGWALLSNRSKRWRETPWGQAWVSFEAHVCGLWLRRLLSWDDEGSGLARALLPGASSHAAHLELVSGSSGIRYVCDHESKHKQAQLGWRGRQWGIVNQGALSQEKGVMMVFRGRSDLPLIRAISAWSRRHYHGHGRRYHVGCGRVVVYGFSPALAARLSSAVADGRICLASEAEDELAQGCAWLREYWSRRLPVDG